MDKSVDKCVVTKAKRDRVDWDALEPHYRAGIRALKDIGSEFGVSDAAIIKHARVHGWARDLSAKIKAGVKVAAIDEFKSSGFVYVIGLHAPSRFFKIGMAKAFPARMEAHQCASPFDLFVVCAYFVPDMRFEERSLHSRFAPQRVRGEWFTLSDNDLVEIAMRSLLIETVS